MRQLAEIDRHKLIAVLRDRLALQVELAHAYQQVIDRLSGSEPALRRIVPHLEQSRDQELAQLDWLRAHIVALRGEDRPSPDRTERPLKATPIEWVRGLLSLEHESHDQWDILTRLAQTAGDEAARQEFAQRLEQEEAHVAYLLGVLRELTRNDVLGVPVTLPI